MIPAAAYTKPSGNTRDVTAMKSFAGGLQVFLPRFSPQGVTVMRGGAWRGGADSCRSGWRMPSSGYGRYNNWGFRAAISPCGSNPPKELKVDLGDGVTMEFVYIKPGTFIMGGSNAKDQKWHGVEVPKHEVTLTKAFYMGKYEVTQAQFEKVLGRNPSAKGNRDPNAPADTVGEGDAVDFCNKVAEKTGQAVRLPTEAEWEYACRAGSKTKFFFGDTPDKLDDYAWYDKNDGGKSHPVGQKKPNPWGLYDILGNVCERVSDKYNKDYYKKSPKADPTGPSQGTKSNMEYEVEVAKAGKYALSAVVCTPKHSQKLHVSANGSSAVMEMPFTVGDWEKSAPVTLELKAGVNTLKLLRKDPPQHGMAIKSFELRAL
jgi:formylglycine-generating enzyme required for sulfatase activity